jgi:putative addiction module killer protein
LPWLESLGDKQAQARIAARLERHAVGNFGDCKAVGHGVNELRIVYGPGYRVYHSIIGKTCVLLLCGGDKGRQAADIAKAIEFLRDYKKRGGNR